MAYERKPGDIAIFKERDKKSERAPDWKGELLTPSGEKLSVALWFKSDTMLAGKVEVPRQKDEGQAFRGGGAGGVSGGGGQVEDHGALNPRRGAFDLDDEVPFVTRDTIR